MTITGRRLVIAYFTLSLLALIFGGPLLSGIPYLWGVPHILFGPFSILSHAIWGRGYPSMADWSISWFSMTLYVLATALLAGCVMLAIQRNRLMRVMGYGAAVVIWALSGYLMLIG
jgi:hypothetical protein